MTASEYFWQLVAANAQQNNHKEEDNKTRQNKCRQDVDGTAKSLPQNDLRLRSAAMGAL
jgi:hypothetical protein